MPSYDYNKKYAEKYLSGFERLTIRMSTEEKEAIKNHAEAKGESVNAFVLRCIRKEIANNQ